MVSAQPQQREDRPFTAIFVGAVVAGTILEIYFLFALRQFKGYSPLEAVQWDASTVLGRAAFSQGFGSALVGIVMHYLVSIVWASLYVFGFSRLRASEMHPVVAGSLFGIIVWFAMTFVVLPLSEASHLEVGPVTILSGIVGHVVFFGIPLALVTRRFENAGASAGLK